MKLTLKEAAAESGIGWSTLRTQVHRGRIASEREASGRIVVDRADLEAFIAAEGLRAVADAVEDVGSGKVEAATAAKAVGVEFGNVIVRMPQEVRDAILDGIPTSKKPGSGEAFRKKAKLHDVAPMIEDDVHFGFPVGHKHVDAPRWKRTSKTTWSLDGSSWTWNGLFWEGGGGREGVALEHPNSPAHPDASLRPLAPPLKVTK